MTPLAVGTPRLSDATSPRARSCSTPVERSEGVLGSLLISGSARELDDESEAANNGGFPRQGS